MKFTLFALIFALTAIEAQAQYRFEASNKAGGQIVMTDRTCPDDARLRAAYKTSSAGDYVEGCWISFDQRFHVVWHDEVATRSAYEFGAFRVINVATGKEVTEAETAAIRKTNKNKQ